MKKVMLLAAILLSSTGVFAQHAVGSFTLQPKVGINVASLTKLNADSKIGLAVGAEGEYQATDLLSISVGALYSQQGAEWDEDNVSYKTKLDYINVPVLANVYVAKGLAVKAGLQPGFVVNDHNNNAKSVDLSIPVGLSYEYSNFVIDGRYNWGVTKVFNNSDPKNSVFQFTVGYKFNL